MNSRAGQEVRARARKRAAGRQKSPGGVSKSAHVQVDPSAGAIVQPVFGSARGDVATVLVRGPRRRANVVHGSANGQSARPARARAPGSEVIGAGHGAPVPLNEDVDPALSQLRPSHGEGHRGSGGQTRPDGGDGPCAGECPSALLEPVPAIGAFGPPRGARPRARPARVCGGGRVKRGDGARARARGEAAACRPARERPGGAPVSSHAVHVRPLADTDLAPDPRRARRGPPKGENGDDASAHARGGRDERRNVRAIVRPEQPRGESVALADDNGAGHGAPLLPNGQGSSWLS